MFDINVQYSEEDREYVATCDKFPSLSYLDTTKEKAREGMIALIMDIVLDMTKNGELLPQ